ARPCVRNASKPPLEGDTRNRAAALDALAFYAATGITQPISPYSVEPVSTQTAQQIVHGRQLFKDANAAVCHGGPGWASSRFKTVVNDVLTRAKDEGVDVLSSALRDVGTFNKAAPNEVKANGTTAAG